MEKEPSLFHPENEKTFEAAGEDGRKGFLMRMNRFWKRAAGIILISAAVCGLLHGVVMAGTKEDNQFSAFATDSPDKTHEYELTVALGEKATLRVTAQAREMDGITCQWLDLQDKEYDPEDVISFVSGGDDDTTRYSEDGTKVILSEWTEIPGATAFSYTSDPITRNTQYSCRVTDKYGNQ